MSTILTIPLVNQPQEFQITLGATTYNFVLKWNYVSLNWVLDIYDQDDNPIVRGIPLITGADLFEQYGYLGFGGQLIAQTDGDVTVPPTFENLGNGGSLYFATP
jgi:hypothetical protein